MTHVVRFYLEGIERTEEREIIPAWLLSLTAEQPALLGEEGGLVLSLGAGETVSIDHLRLPAGQWTLDGLADGLRGRLFRETGDPDALEGGASDAVPSGEARPDAEVSPDSGIALDVETLVRLELSATTATTAVELVLRRIERSVEGEPPVEPVLEDG